MSGPDDDATKLAAARELGLTGTKWCLRHHFHFTFNQEGAYAAYEELRRLGFPDVTADEELTGGGYWHVIAWRMENLTEESVAASRELLEELAARLGGEYTGWDVVPTTRRVREHEERQAMGGRDRA